MLLCVFHTEASAQPFAFSSVGGISKEAWTQRSIHGGLFSGTALVGLALVSMVNACYLFYLESGERL